MATPDRALVFELKGPVANFIVAAKSLGLEWLTEDYADLEGDDESAYDDDEAGASTLYVTMPTLKGLQSLLALWRRYTKGEAKPTDAREWWALFGYLTDVRTWSAKDRVDPSVARYVERSIQAHPDRPVRLELDLWYRDNAELRATARSYLDILLEAVDGTLLDFATIEPIQYQAALIELPGQRARELSALTGPVALADPVMRVRPQSHYAIDDKDGSVVAQTNRDAPDSLNSRPAVAALIDGYPVQNHQLLRNRIDVEEVDVAGADVPVGRRFHGTSMASLILHGDLDANEPPLDRPLKVVPILAAPQSVQGECTPPDKLPIAMVYRAITSLMIGLDGAPATGENVVLINHSICDVEAPFARRPTPWAKLIDFLSHEYSLLFIISAGNIREAFPLDTYDSFEELEAADPIERQVVMLRSLERAKGVRSILSPAEAINALTVGAMHADSSADRPGTHIDPFDQTGVVAMCSATGLGVNRAIKPDLVEAGGRQIIGGEDLDPGVSVWGREIPQLGQLAAAPDIFGGGTNKTLRSTGTSNAAALLTRSGLHAVDVLEDLFSATGQNWTDQTTRAVTLRALLAHGCAWGGTGELLDAIYPPGGQHGWQRRREAISRSIGYGRANLDRILNASGHRITLLADDEIGHDESHEYLIPVPRAFLNNREVRRVVLTLAWSSPIEPSSTRYRGFGLEVVSPKGDRKFWNGVDPVLQPHPFATRRGTLQHLILSGKKLVKASGDGHFSVAVQARAAFPALEKEKVPYALAVTVELAQNVRQDLFADVEARVRAKVSQASAVRPRQRVRSGN